MNVVELERQRLSTVLKVKATIKRIQDRNVKMKKVLDAARELPENERNAYIERHLGH